MSALRFSAPLLLLSSLAAAQMPPATTHTPQVNADHSVTFTLYAPTAKAVVVNTDAYAKPLPMVKAENGLWSVTTRVLEPNLYAYGFDVDKVSELDPLNNDVRNNYAFNTNQVMVPGTPPMPWELKDVAHGRVDEVRFTTHVALHLPANQSAYAVYTPAGYDAKKKGGYPVLYLLHGWSDNETVWTAVGRANFILDDLIASGKAAPMIVVMPFGYGDLDFVTTGYNVWGNPTAIDHNTELFEKALLTEVVPAVEKSYNVASGRENHAIAGLSMGGLESLTVGLHNTDMFAYVIGMSSAIHQRKFDEHFPNLASTQAGKKTNLKLLWVGCGTGDGLIEPNRDFVKWAKAKGLPVTPVETPGAHTWLVWRDNLLTVAPLLFRK